MAILILGNIWGSWATRRDYAGDYYAKSGTGWYKRRVTTHTISQIVGYVHRIVGTGTVWKRGRGFVFCH